jgi:hypothetical protein
MIVVCSVVASFSIFVLLFCQWFVVAAVGAFVLACVFMCPASVCNFIFVFVLIVFRPLLLLDIPLHVPFAYFVLLVHYSAF